MVFHPRERSNFNGSTTRPAHLWTRRDFVWRAAALGISLPTLSGILAACGDRAGDVAAEILIGTPSNPVIQPIFDDNVAIASGLPPEAGPLRVYNWNDYINPETIPLAEEALGVNIEVTVFYNEEEAFPKLLSGEIPFDVWIPAGESVGKAVAGKLIQPINHEYLPNLAPNIWPELADPFYDKGSQYTVPYLIYQTGIGWRDDMVDGGDIESLENPWDVFWNPEYYGITGMYDDFRETMQLAMFRAGIAEPRDATPEQVAAAADSLVELVDLMNIKYTIDGTYQGIPEARFGLHHAWSGDIVNAQYYFPEDGDPSVLRYMWPAKGANSRVNALLANDTMAVVRNAEHPVLAHQFLNFLLDTTNALHNFSYLGYQPPQNTLDPETLVADGWIPENVASAVVTKEDFGWPQATVPTQLTPETEALWLENWNRAVSGG